MRAVDGVKAFMATWIKPGHRGKRGLQIRTVTPERWTVLMAALRRSIFGGLGLGDGSTDLEHSIMLRQRSLSSRTSLDDLAK